jgi:23S rRNA G2445 N2-methylase RlmL
VRESFARVRRLNDSRTISMRQVIGRRLCEPAIAGHQVWGTDIAPGAIDAARINIATVKREYWNRIENADSTSSKTWQRHRSATVVVANLPWGKQAAIKSKQALYDSISSGVADVSRRGGTGVLLTTEPERIMQRLRRSSAISLNERRIGLGQTRTVLTIRSAD